ncbi:MAG: hypothetical protein JNK45_18715 [Myxococcales bacterium]|nr:hypothetical protein [Myxococcales bacterium]
MSWSRRRMTLGLLASASCGSSEDLGRAQTPPTAPVSAWRRALGPVDDLAPEHASWLLDARAYAQTDARTLAIARRHGERSQGVDEHLAAAPNPVVDGRSTLVVQPLGGFPFDVIEGNDFVGLVRTPPLADLAAVLAATFGLAVEVLPARPLVLDSVSGRTRRGFTQLDAQSVLHSVAAELPPHAYAMLTLVNHDLYALPEQDYAFGWSLHRDRQGVASFARFDPSFHGGLRPDDLEQAILRRSVRLLLHECAHMFGLTHCTYFRCALGPIDVLADLDARPPYPCPVCQCKLLRSAGVDPIAAVRRSVAVFAQLGLHDEAAWGRRRLEGTTA